MGIKAVVENLDDVPAQYHDLYTQQGDKFVLTGVDDVKPIDEFNRVYGGLTKERSDHKASKTKLDAWATLGTPEEVQSKLDRIAELEAAAGGALDEAAIDKLVTTRLSSRTAPLERTIQQLTASSSEKDQVIAQYRSKEQQRAIGDSLRAAISKHEGFQQTAFEDAVMLAERVFEVDEDGRVVTKDGMGVTPGIDAAVWLTEMQAKRPHWWGTSQGGGAKGNNGAGGGGSNPYTHENWNVTEQNKLYTANAARAEQMAKSAGTTPGGMRPAPRK